MSKNDIFSLFHLRDNKKIKLSDPQFAYAVYKNRRVNLLNNIESNDGLIYLKNLLKEINLNSNLDEAVVVHCYYELGFVFEDPTLIKDDELLAIVIKYKKVKAVSFKKNKERINLKALKSISKKEYSLKFKKVQNHLNKGNCYQLNLTNKFCFSFKETNHRVWINKLFSDDKNLSAYAHATYIKPMDKLILSNSPECLFNIKDNEIFTMPIKGTTFQDHTSWAELLNSNKEQAELFMITDLMRNDLTKIALTPSEVILKKAKLIVPKIWHQYSLIKTTLPKATNFYQILKCLFPGGSITGAPKSNAVNYLKDIEKQNRGIYCGSTILIHKSLKSASINIRTAELNFKTKVLSYGSGGGVTLLSETNSEYEEMFLKLESFLSIFDNK